jgi:hypothetical protein
MWKDRGKRGKIKKVASWIRRRGYLLPAGLIVVQGLIVFSYECVLPYLPIGFTI